jgi:hypothetical protein
LLITCSSLAHPSVMEVGAPIETRVKISSQFKNATGVPMGVGGAFSSPATNSRYLCAVPPLKITKPSIIFKNFYKTL